MTPKMALSGKMTVRYASGREDLYELELYGGGAAEHRLKEIVESPALVLQTETELLILPWTSIERVTVALPTSAGKQVAFPNVRRAKRLS